MHVQTMLSNNTHQSMYSNNLHNTGNTQKATIQNPHFNNHHAELSVHVLIISAVSVITLNYLNSLI